MNLHYVHALGGVEPLFLRTGSRLMEDQCFDIPFCNHPKVIYSDLHEESAKFSLIQRMLSS